MRHSEALDQLAPALVKARAAMTAVHKDGVSTTNRYATLEALLDMAVPHLLANGLMLVQGGGRADEAGSETETRLLHISGQWIETILWLPLIGNRISKAAGGGYEPISPRAAGSTNSYGRRYGALGILCIVPTNEDDDAEVASTPEAKVYQRPAVAPASPAGASKPAKAPSGGVPKSCPNCGGKIWNNLEKKASGQFKASSPDWSCADAECKKRPGSVGWPEKDAKAEFAAMPEVLEAPLPGEPDWDE